MLTARQACITAAVLGAIGVGLGAFASHYLADMLTDSHLNTFKTGTSYLQLHAVVMLVAGLCAFKWTERRFILAATGFALGMFVFSGSLTILAVTGISWLGALAPVGGLILIASWLFLAAGFWRVTN